jgi:hypothetical protein
MRERFNRGKYWERVLRGELFPVVIDQGQPQPEIAAKEPSGTVSQTVSYRDRNNDEVARVHQYLRPDGKLGASGLPDPKRLFEEETFFRLIKKANATRDAM